jgi:DNA-binding SARP family transcriptional activator/predicted ATPase/Tfp pilus assembly protein PilF
MLDVNLLGETNICLDAEPISGFRSQTEIALLAYLAHSGQAHNREALADLLWDANTTEQSLSNLRTALARLRKQVGEYLIVTRKTIAVTPKAHQQTDSVRFQTLLAGAGKAESAAVANQLSQGLALYTGEFMAGFSLPHAPRFNDWLVIEGERIRQLALNGFRQLADWQEGQGNFTPGVHTIQRWLALDPWDETARQKLFRMLAYDGRRSEALSAYEKYKDLLQKEIGIPPDPETVVLSESIQAGSLTPPLIASAPLHNLLRPLLPLFGREQETSKLKDHLLNPDYPLISVTGIGGIGKTSLTLSTGRALVSDEEILTNEQRSFPDGIWFVALEGIEYGTPEKVREEVAALVGQAMGLYFHGESDLWTQLLGQLSTKNVLLILDNIEQFLTVASDLILELLEAGEGIHLLTTSRTTLPLATSLAFPLEGLETPKQISDEAIQNESVQLFAERASRLPNPFHLEKHLADVVEICQFMQGLPLGIELAAASLGRLLIGEIMPALKNNLRLINSSRSDLPPRQRTFHAVFEYTWGLLDPREQTLLVQISVFRGGFTRQAAEAVVHDTGSGLYNLHLHALLNRDETGRFRMHPLLRQLAGEKLSVIELRETRDRHSSYFSDLIGSFETKLRGGIGREALQIIFPEQANLRATWEHAVQTGQWQLIANCLDSAHYFFQRNGLHNEEDNLVEIAINTLQLVEEEGNAPLTILLSRLLTLQALGYLSLANFKEGLKTAEKACELAQSVKDTGLEAQARIAMGKLLFRDHAKALSQYEQVVALAKIAEEPFLEADALCEIGEHLPWQGKYEQARESLEHALALCQSLPYKSGELYSQILLADLSMNQGKYSESIATYEQALQLSRLLGDVTKEALILGNMGVSLNALGDLIGTQRVQEESLATYRRLNLPIDVQILLGSLGHTTLQLGDYATAEKQLTEALSIAIQTKDEFWQAWVKLRLGEMWHEKGESEKALTLIAEAFQTAKEVQNHPFLAAVLYHWGNLSLTQKDWAEAEKKFQEAYDLWNKRGKTENVMQALAGLAYAAYQQEKVSTAASHAEHLWQSWQDSPARAERANLKLYWMLGMVWQGLEDSRFEIVREKAQTLLHERSEKIEDDVARQMFLQNVTVHRAILENS